MRYDWSQWSLTFEVRKRHAEQMHIRHIIWQSQWSLTFEVRKRGGTPILEDGMTLSQWSLTFEVRKRRSASTSATAMEPDL